MQVARWGNSLAIRIPVAVTRALSLAEGDEVEVTAREGRLELAKVDREAAIARIRAMAVSMPKGWKFNRDELYEPGFDEG